MKLDILPESSRSLKTAAIVSFLLLAPFIILESVTTRGFARGFPAALFIFMWVLGVSFVGILHNVAAGRRSVPNFMLVLKGGAQVGKHLNLLGVYLPGYRVTLLGSVIGFIYMFVIGYGLGRIVGSLYNRLVEAPTARIAR